jgi:hypothetical protein
MTLDEYFDGHDDARPLFEVLRSAADALGPSGMCVMKSQVAFWPSAGICLGMDAGRLPAPTLTARYAAG